MSKETKDGVWLPVIAETAELLNALRLMAGTRDVTDELLIETITLVVENVQTLIERKKPRAGKRVETSFLQGLGMLMIADIKESRR